MISKATEQNPDGHRIVAQGAGAAITCTLQALTGRVDGQSLELTSTAADQGGTLRVRTAGVGRADGVMHPVASGRVVVESGRVCVLRPDVCEELSTTSGGIRQDFVVLECPAGVGELAVALDVDGGTAVAHGADLDLTFASGRVLRWHGLQVTDAKGQRLTASWQVQSDTRLAVLVDDTAAVYPVRIDPTFTDADWFAMGLADDLGGTNDAVYAMVPYAGGIVVGGSFTLAGHTLVNRVALWNGSAWLALGTGMSSTVRALAVSGTDLYAGGLFSTAGGVSANRIAKWDGSAWSALGTGMDRPVFALAVSGTDIYAGGAFSGRIAKWNSSDSTWSALGTGMDNSVYALAVSGSDIYAGGEFTTAGVPFTQYIAKWKSSDNTWSALGTGMDNSVYALAVSDTDVYAGGWFSRAGSVPASRIAKWKISDDAWSALGTGMSDGVYTLAVSGTDVYAGGYFSTAGDVTANHIARWGRDTWSSLGTGSDGEVYALAVSGSKLYVGGQFRKVGGVNANNIAGWDGNAWFALGTGMNDSVPALAVSGADVYAGGGFTTADGKPANYIAKWDGITWSALGLGMDNGVQALAVSGPDVYVGGYFSKAGGEPANYIAKWNHNDQAWSALGTGMNYSVSTLAVSGPDVYAGGDFTTAGGKPASRIAKWDGSAWSALGTGTNGSISALAVSGPNVYAGGDFNTAGGVTTNFIAKWDGSAWSALGTGTRGSVYDLAVSGTDLYVAGSFSNAGGVSANKIVRWNGVAWSALGSGLDATPVALAASGTNLYVGGVFDLAGEKFSPGLARVQLYVPPGVPTDSNASANAVAENAESGTTVGVTVAAVNTAGGTLTYALSDDAGGRFAINPSTGVVTVAGSLDYESATSHTITVVADNGASSNRQSFTITVSDGPDLVPVITWPTPAPITYGTLLSGTQLNAAADVAGTYTYSPAVGSLLTAGSQTLKVTFTPTDAANYRNATSSVTLTVDRASLTVTANAASRLYGAANPTFTGVITGLVTGDAITGTYASAAIPTTVIGTYGPATSESITPTLVDHNGRLSNYTVTTVNGALTISPAPLTVTAANASRVLGDPNPTFTGTLTGVVAGDVITATYASSATATTAVGVYGPTTAEAITPTLVDAGSRLGNYTVTATKGTLTITAAPGGNGGGAGGGDSGGSCGLGGGFAALAFLGLLTLQFLAMRRRQ